MLRQRFTGTSQLHSMVSGQHQNPNTATLKDQLAEYIHLDI